MSATPGDRRRTWTIRLAIVATIVALMVVFVAENFVIVEVRLFAQQVQMRLAWAVLIAAGLGMVVGLLLPRLWR